MTRTEAIKLLKAELKEASELRYILPFVLKEDFSRMIAYGSESISEAEERQLKEIIKQRKEHIPLQYILREWYFMDLTLYVDENVLIPRQDTETLCELAIDYAKRSDSKTMLDICTGSGCIALAVKKAVPRLKVTAGDISEKALEVARKNADLNQLEVCYEKSDLFNNIEGSFDIITANPPYIAESEYEALEKELTFEPKLALVAEEDGLALYKRIAKEAKAKLNKGGAIFLEIGSSQAFAVSEMLCESGFINIETIKDLAGNDRVVRANAN